MDSTTKWLIGIAIVTIIFIYRVAPGVLLGIVIFSILMCYLWWSVEEENKQLEIDRRLAREKKERIRAKEREEERIKKEKLRTYGHDMTDEDRS